MKSLSESDWRFRGGFETLTGGAGTRLPRLPARFGPAVALLRDLLLRLPPLTRRELPLVGAPDEGPIEAECFVRFDGGYSCVIVEP